MKPKHQRLTLILLALTAVSAAGALGLSALGDTATYFYSPSDVAAKGVAPGEPARLGGMVQAGSLKKTGTTLSFVVGDGMKTVPVRFDGIAPDLFREGSGMIADGRFDESGTFIADNILAKHDETYKPPEDAGSEHKVMGKVE